MCWIFMSVHNLSAGWPPSWRLYQRVSFLWLWLGKAWFVIMLLDVMRLLAMRCMRRNLRVKDTVRMRWRCMGTWHWTCAFVWVTDMEIWSYNRSNLITKHIFLRFLWHERVWCMWINFHNSKQHPISFVKTTVWCIKMMFWYLCQFWKFVPKYVFLTNLSHVPWGSLYKFVKKKKQGEEKYISLLSNNAFLLLSTENILCSVKTCFCMSGPQKMFARWQQNISGECKKIFSQEVTKNCKRKENFEHSQQMKIF